VKRRASPYMCWRAIKKVWCEFLESHKSSSSSEFLTWPQAAVASVGKKKPRSNGPVRHLFSPRARSITLVPIRDLHQNMRFAVACAKTQIKNFGMTTDK